MDCIFCSIINGDIPSKKVYEDDDILAFEDINPCAPVHIVIIPKVHIASVNYINQENSELISKIFIVAKKLASNLGISETGYRIITNTGKDAGQTVNHLHFHLLGGHKLKVELG